MNAETSSTTQAELLDQLSQQYEIVTDSLTVDGQSFTFYRLADPDKMLDDKMLETAHGQLRWQPYWAKTWDAAYGICALLGDRDLAGRRVLDLGCGLGITGSVAAARGASVMLADNAPPALEFAKLNSWPWRDQVEIAQVDWRRDDLGRRFDLIIGSDILYDREDLPHLDAFWRRHLRPAGTVLVGDPTRPMTREFYEWLAQHGWTLSETTKIVPQVDRPIRIVTVTPNP